MASYDGEYEAMQYLTQQYLGKICRIWEQIFEKDVCKENLRKLIEHANNFYSELVEESIGRKDVIMEEIQDLKKEAEDLKRLLHVDVELPCYGLDSVPLLRVQSDMDKSLEHLREQLRLRKEEICELLLQQEALCEELGESPRDLLDDPLPTAEELNKFKIYLEDLRRERDDRLNKIVTLRREIRNFLDVLELEIHCESEDRLLNRRQIKVNRETFNGLNRMHLKYATEVEQLKERVDAMRTKLNFLWERLQTSPNTRHKFDRLPKYKQHTYDAIYNELQRCEQLKKQNIKQYVQEIRQEIRECWDKCLKSEKERERFSNFTCNTYTDDLLILHEMELQDLKLHYETYKQIYELFAERNDLWERMCALEAKASEPGRYNNRGGQLLKEEKQRKIIATKLPKLEQQIAELVKEFEEKEHRSFLVHGENIIDVMAGQWEEKRREKEKVQTARKNALTASAVKPNSTLRTPMLLKNASSVSSVRKTPHITSMSVNPTTSSKRKLHPSENITPSAKRSLLRALDSPSLSLKPSTSKNNNNKISSPIKKPSILKSSLKKPKPIIGSTIKRRSLRHSNGHKKRKSIIKNYSKVIPKIVIQDFGSTDGFSTDYNAEETYDSFQPALRSSMIHNITSSVSSSRVHRIKKIVDENERLAKLPRPPMSRTPSRQNMYSPTNIHNHSSMASTAGRKLTTKNLPILI